jgi:hypothetical protein
MKKRTKVIAALFAALLLIAAIAIPAVAAGPFENERPGDGVCDGTGPAGHGAAAGAGSIQEVSELLGLSVDEIREQRLEGLSLVEIAEEKNISEDDLLNVILSARTDFIQLLVDEGKIDQEQADFMLSNAEERITEMINRTETGKPSWAGQGGRGNRAMSGINEQVKAMDGSCEGTVDGESKMLRGAFGRAK